MSHRRGSSHELVALLALGLLLAGLESAEATTLQAPTSRPRPDAHLEALIRRAVESNDSTLKLFPVVSESLGRLRPLRPAHAKRYEPLPGDWLQLGPGRPDCPPSSQRSSDPSLGGACVPIGQTATLEPDQKSDSPTFDQRRRRPRVLRKPLEAPTIWS